MIAYNTTTFFWVLGFLVTHYIAYTTPPSFANDLMMAMDILLVIVFVILPIIIFFVLLLMGPEDRRGLHREIREARERRHPDNDVIAEIVAAVIALENIACAAAA
jgi:hypothetical protein